MKLLKSVLFFETKKTLSRKALLLLMIPFLFSLIFIQIGVLNYKQAVSNKERFQEIEKSKVSQFVSYYQYSAYGFRLLFVPSPFSVFAVNTGVTNDMVSSIDTTERIKIDNPLIGKNLFNLKKTGFTNFSGIILFFGSLLSIFYGYLAFNDREYSKFLVSMSGTGTVFAVFVAVRLLILAVLLMLLILFSVLVIVLNHIPLPLDLHLFILFLSIFATNCFFFILGTLFSTSKSKLGSILSSFITWFTLIFIIPALVDGYISGKANFITDAYKIEIAKFKVITDFENNAVTKYGMYSRNEQTVKREQELMESYWSGSYKDIEKLEDSLMDETVRVIDSHSKLSALFPSTFYFSVINEYGSWGYENYLSFYRHVRKTKTNFLRFYINKRYYTEGKVIEPFVTKDENIFYGQSRLPRYFNFGLILLLLYISILTIISYYRFKKAIFPLPDHDKSDLNNNVIKLASGENRVFLVEDYRFRNQLYSLLSGECDDYAETGYQGKVFVNDRDLVAKPERSNFIYICPPFALPTDISAGDFIRLIASGAGRPPQEVKKLIAQLPADIIHQRIGRLDKQSKGEILLTILDINPHDIYLIEDIGRGMPVEFNALLRDKMDALKNQGALVIYLTTDDLLLVKHVRKNQSFYESSTWLDLVSRYHGLKS